MDLRGDVMKSSLDICTNIIRDMLVEDKPVTFVSPNYVRFKDMITRYVYERNLDSTLEWSVISELMIYTSSQFLSRVAANKILINLKLLVYKVVNCLYYIKSFKKEELINIGFMGLIKGLNYIKHSTKPIIAETYTKILFYTIKYFIFRELDRFLHGRRKHINYRLGTKSLFDKVYDDKEEKSLIDIIADNKKYEPEYIFFQYKYPDIVLSNCYKSINNDLDRIIFNMYYYEHLSVYSIAKKLNISKSNVHRRIQKYDSYLKDNEVSTNRLCTSGVIRAFNNRQLSKMK